MRFPDAAPGPAAIADPARARRSWIARAIEMLRDERATNSETPLLPLACPELPGVHLYLKDESAQVSGSLKHRLAQSLFLHAICDGAIGPDTAIVEASSGSTAISEAWFARKLGLRFIAVVPAHTAPAKLAAIREMGGEIDAVDPGCNLREHADRLATAIGGFFMDQFGRAAEATDWRGANNIAQELFTQLATEPHPVPRWLVVGAGTGGTGLTLGRYIRLRPELSETRLCVVDPEGSAFYPAWLNGDRSASGRASTVVEGIGRAQVEPAFNPALIDHMLAVPDAASVAAAHWLERRSGRRFGPSTGTNVVGALTLGLGMARAGTAGSIVTLACDRGDRYASTIYDSGWLAAAGLDRDMADWTARLTTLGSADFPNAF